MWPKGFVCVYVLDGVAGVSGMGGGWYGDVWMGSGLGYWEVGE